MAKSSTTFKKGHIVSQEIREKIRQNRKPIKYWLGKKRPYHSLETRLKMRAAAKKGNKNHAWKGGMTSLRKIIRESFEYHNWRFQVFKRDKYTCKICGVQGGWDKNKKITVILNVDHLKQFIIILKENNIKNLEEARSCKELWNLDNGRTLCLKCHRETETYGKST